jgi:6-pyruvoyl-tetrahydropterin synthase
MKIEVLEVIENEDGTCSVVFDYDDKFVDLVKETLQKEEVTEEEISQYVVDCIDKGILELQKQELSQD